MSIGLKELQVDAMPHVHASEILSPDVLQFLLSLHKEFDAKRLVLLEKRETQQRDFNKGLLPTFRKVHAQAWQTTSMPEDLRTRVVEITGPANRKMIINALNSGADTFMADFEDSLSPTWNNVINGHKSIYDAARKKISLEEQGKKYTLNEQTAVLIVRPRGLHLQEAHVLINQQEISASLFDFGVFFFKNGKQLLADGSGPYLYIPKLENAEEAAWWAEVFEFSEKYLGLQPQKIKVTVLAETITASFELEAIIYALRNYIVGINCGRWDYIFSYIKKFNAQEDFILPDRNSVTMSSPFMDAYVQLVIQTCHRYGIMAIGGMAAQIPIKGDDKRNLIAYEKVYSDKIREVKAGHDGTWVAHPAMVGVAKNAFSLYMKGSNQLLKPISNRVITEQELLQAKLGEVTIAGVKDNIYVALVYLSHWLQGQGAVAINNLMEDAATVEIARAQLWQWLKFQVPLDDGQRFDLARYRQLQEEVLHTIEAPDLINSIRDEALSLLDKLVLAEQFIPFSTLLGYKKLTHEKFN